MTDADQAPAPTGAFGEGAGEQPAEETKAASYARETSQDVSRSLQEEPKDKAQEGTAEHAPMIDRPRA
jgi:hypothetical protein